VASNEPPATAGSRLPPMPLSAPPTPRTHNRQLLTELARSQLLRDEARLASEVTNELTTARRN
jgi:hypothetical protein